MGRTILGLLGLLLAAGCAAHAQGSARNAGIAATDRAGDGWKRASDRDATAPSKKTPAPPTKVAAVSKPAIPATPDYRAKAVANGRAILAGTGAKPKRDDCSGFVTAAYERAGLSLQVSPESQKGTTSMAEMLYRTAKADGRTHDETPKPGDLVFYRNTFGKIDGRITHVAMVESVAKDGTVTVIHNIGGRYRRSPMNLADPHEPLKNGYFRKKQTANEPVLAGELFVAYARPRL